MWIDLLQLFHAPKSVKPLITPGKSTTVCDIEALQLGVAGFVEEFFNSLESDLDTFGYLQIFQVRAITCQHRKGAILDRSALKVGIFEF